MGWLKRLFMGDDEHDEEAEQAKDKVVVDALAEKNRVSERAARAIAEYRRAEARVRTAGDALIQEVKTND